MKRIRAFVLGLIEFRSDVTSAFDTDCESDAYDHGRDLAHRLTLRRFDH